MVTKANFASGLEGILIVLAAVTIFAYAMENYMVIVYLQLIWGC